MHSDGFVRPSKPLQGLRQVGSGLDQLRAVLPKLGLGLTRTPREATPRRRAFEVARFLALYFAIYATAWWLGYLF